MSATVLLIFALLIAIWGLRSILRQREISLEQARMRAEVAELSESLRTSAARIQCLRAVVRGTSGSIGSQV